MTAQESTNRLQIGGKIAVNRIGLGAMRLSSGVLTRAETISRASAKTILRRALDLGLDFIDTADIYADGENEQLVGSFVPQWAKVATKGGLYLTVGGEVKHRGRPDALRECCIASCQRLKREPIDLYYLHRVDPTVPLEESIGSLLELKREGKIREIGLSNVSLDELNACKDGEIAAVQNTLNIVDRSSAAIVEYCRSKQIVFVASGPLGGRPMVPGAPLASSTGLLSDIAKSSGLTPVQVALMWILNLSSNTVVIPGTTSIGHLEENAATLQLFHTLRSGA
jgi:pyridoxine 4-dehydrogenase